MDNRQNAKYLLFQKLQPPKKVKGFYIFSHSLPSRTRRVLFFLVTYWSFGLRQLTGEKAVFLRVRFARSSLVKSPITCDTLPAQD